MNHIQTTTPSATTAGQYPMPLARQGCRLCGFKLKREDGDDLASALCASCKTSPEAADLRSSAWAPPDSALAASASPFSGLVAAVTGVPVAAAVGSLHAPGRSPREFGEADLALIRKIGAFMPEQKLLEILNERLACDLDANESSYTLEQLTTAIQEVHGGKNPAALGRDWPSLRKLLAQARRTGVLARINEQVINDFAVVFQLNAKQVVELKDIVLGAMED